MPIYDYKCKTCGRFEYSQKITDEPLSHCPKCQGEVERLISHNVNVLYKADGFYTTDYNRSENYKKAKRQESSGSSSGSN
jgi:putative FmdB family regulatory protein